MPCNDLRIGIGKLPNIGKRIIPIKNKLLFQQNNSVRIIILKKPGNGIALGGHQGRYVKRDTSHHQEELEGDGEVSGGRHLNLPKLTAAGNHLHQGRTAAHRTILNQLNLPIHGCLDLNGKLLTALRTGDQDFLHPIHGKKCGSMVINRVSSPCHMEGPNYPETSILRASFQRDSRP